MDILALVNVIVTIIAIFIGLGAHSWWNKRYFNKITKDRLKKLRGTWEGKISQYSDNDNIVSENKICFRKKRFSKLIIGRAKSETLYEGKNVSLDVKFLGGFVRDDSIFKLDYCSRENKSIRFGTVIFKLPLNLEVSSIEMKGKMVGFSPTMHECLVKGDVEITKISDKLEFRI